MRVQTYATFPRGLQIITALLLFRLASVHGSLDRRRNYSGGSGDQHEGGYRSLERNSSAPVILPELQPSKYGSKRESTADPPGHYEGPEQGGGGFYTGADSDSDLPPPPPPIAYGSGYGDGYAGSGSAYPPPPPLHQGVELQRHPGDGGSVTGGQYAKFANGTPAQWYESGIKSGGGGAEQPAQIRQQNPPRTPVFENPPMQFVQQEPPPPQQTYNPETQQMTVTKFQSYVEVSKPFEMSDFYKYSEKLRKQRTIEKRQQKLEAVLAGQAIPSPVAGAAGTPGAVRGQGDGSGAPSPRYAAGGGAYPFASPSSPSMSPGSSSSGPPPQGSPALHQRGSRSASPYGDPYRGSPGGGAAFPARGVRGPAAASYGIHSSSSSTTYSTAGGTSTFHAHHQVSYQSSGSVVTPPTKQMVYQPPAPQNCTPIAPSPNSSSASNNTTPNR